MPVPPFGTLRLANPVLLGLSVYLQALVGASPRLTNLETLTLTRL